MTTVQNKEGELRGMFAVSTAPTFAFWSFSHRWTVQFLCVGDDCSSYYSGGCFGKTDIETVLLGLCFDLLSGSQTWPESAGHVK